LPVARASACRRTSSEPRLGYRAALLARFLAVVLGARGARLAFGAGLKRAGLPLLRTSRNSAMSDVRMVSTRLSRAA
jgi:hypothetical protein